MVGIFEWNLKGKYENDRRKKKNYEEINNGKKLMTPKEFKEVFAPMLSVTTCRELFRSREFPSTEVGQWVFTTYDAATKYLSEIEGEKVV